MKNTILIGVLLFFVGTVFVSAQTTNTAMIEDIYQRASKFYADSKYEEAVALLDRAEKLAGVPDAKVLYLKVKVLSALTRQDIKYTESLAAVLTAFKTAASQQNFDATKVQEINNLEQQIVQAQTDLKARQQREQNDFEQAKSSKSVSSLDSFLSKYPNSVYNNEITTLKQGLKQEQYNEQLRQLDADLAKAKRKIGSGRFLTVLGVLTTIGWGAWLADYVERSGESYDPMIAEGVIGSCAIIIPIAFFTSGGAKKKAGKAMKREIEQKRPFIQLQNVSLSPGLNLHHNQAYYGVAARLRF